MDNENLQFLGRYVGETVTIFTTSGGLSGSGFTGVLINVTCDKVTLLVCQGAAPSCPVGSSCDCCDNYGGGKSGCGYGGSEFGYGFGGGYGRGRMCGNRCGSCHGSMRSPMGAITVIPVSAIAAFTHNAI